MSNNLFYTLNDALKKEFGVKIIKLSLDGGFTCPNREDGSGGCIFCSAMGSGEFSAQRSDPISTQLESQIRLLQPKWNHAQYIAYFQNFTNTYAPVEKLRALYDAALRFPNVVGLAIATRPDCLNEEILELLEEYNRKTFLWIELGLQSIHQKTADFIRRGYASEIFDQAIQNLHRRNIRTVAHLILNLPGETIQDMKESVYHVGHSKIWGIKLHMLNILQQTDLAKYYEKNPFPLFSAEEYIALISQLLTLIPRDVCIHRLTGDGDKKSLIAPRWVLNKRYVLNGIQQYMRANGLYQGMNSSYPRRP